MERINKNILQGKERVKIIKAAIKKKEEAPEHYENIYTITENIIKDYKNGTSLKDIKEKYGDFGFDYIIKFLKQKPKNLMDLFLNDTEQEKIKKEIFKKYISGTSKREIKEQYGDYGLAIVTKILETLDVPKI